MVTRRLDAEERRGISSGSVYVWEERGPNPEATGVSLRPLCPPATHAQRHLSLLLLLLLLLLPARHRKMDGREEVGRSRFLLRLTAACHPLNASTCPDGVLAEYAM